jgi:hypothetical protein
LRQVFELRFLLGQRAVLEQRLRELDSAESNGCALGPDPPPMCEIKSMTKAERWVARLSCLKPYIVLVRVKNPCRALIYEGPAKDILLGNLYHW